MKITSKYWIVYNQDMSIIHYGENTECGETTTGLEYSEEFTNKELYIKRLNELNIDTHELI